MKILVINGPNLNLLGRREPEIYGRATYADLLAFLQEQAAALGVGLECRQTNHEGEIIDLIQLAPEAGFDGIVINPAGYTHTSVAILDALLAVPVPAVEVHLSDPDKREEFRRVSYLRPACAAIYKGEGFLSYEKALRFLSENKKNDP